MIELFTLTDDIKPDRRFENVKSLIWTERFNQAGDFEFLCEATGAMRSLVRSRKFVCWSEADEVMLLDNSEIYTTGPNKGLMKVSGKSLSYFLRNRYPPDLYFQQNFEVTPGINMLGVLLRYSIGEDASPNDQMTDYILYTPTFMGGKVVSVGTDRKSTYDLMKDICVEGDIGFRTYRSSSGSPPLRLGSYEGTDYRFRNSEHGKRVLSSEDGSLIDSTRIFSRENQKSVAIVRYNNGSVITVLGPGGSSLPWGRRVLEVDANDITTETLSSSQASYRASARGRAALLESRQRSYIDARSDGIKLTYSPLAIQASHPHNYFFLGDVFVLDDGMGYSEDARVVEYIRTVNEAGLNGYPTFETV